jgi:hypothetical protein
MHQATVAVKSKLHIVTAPLRFGNDDSSRLNETVQQSATSRDANWPKWPFQAVFRDLSRTFYTASLSG